MKLRFSLRAILVLVTLLALWCAYSMNWIRQRRAAIASRHVQVLELKGGEAPLAPGLLWVFGEKGHYGILLNSENDEESNAAASLFPESKRSTSYAGLLIP